MRFPSYRFIYSPGRRTQSHRQSREGTKARAHRPRAGMQDCTRREKPPKVSPHFINPQGGRGPKCASYPLADPSFPEQPDSGRRLRMFPGLDGGQWEPPTRLRPHRGPGRFHSAAHPSRNSTRSQPETGVGEGDVLPGRTQG